ncbi:unnamed protein product [Eruca vesicaria subsp. sativa]|uniref:Uncharacterized protein n=1 Tax=Eruca vesicaria subsp. sativa TaxID=29727 RepID=A0ABC8JBX0_ERUVS|nr:unnamed protein product [Eruca vesicaria subsp. sativa]
MAKNSQSSSKSQEKKKGNRVCEKIFRAVTSPVRTVRRISTKPSPNHHHHHQAEAVRVKLSETAKPITTSEPKKTLITRVETTLKTDERFTDYIKKAKLKIRAMTRNDDVSDASETETRDHHHHHHQHVPISRVPRESSSGRSSDRFSEYINKAKMKLRSSSTVVRANTTHGSFKH